MKGICMNSRDEDTTIVVCVTIISIASVGGYALSLGYNHTLPTAIITAISAIGMGYYGYKKGKRQIFQEEDDEEGEGGRGPEGDTETGE
jgi:hypothetical protein